MGRVHGKLAGDDALHHGQIFPAKPARVQFFLQKLTGVGVFGGAQQAAGALVQPVEGTKDERFAKARRQPVFQRARRLPLRALAGQGSGLVDDVKVVAFKDDVHGQKLRHYGLRRRVFRPEHLHHVARFEQCVRQRRLAVDAHAAGHLQRGKLRVGHAQIAAHEVLKLAPGVLFPRDRANERHTIPPKRPEAQRPGPCFYYSPKSTLIFNASSCSGLTSAGVSIIRQFAPCALGRRPRRANCRCR